MSGRQDDNRRRSRDDAGGHGRHSGSGHGPSRQDTRQQGWQGAQQQAWQGQMPQQQQQAQHGQQYQGRQPAAAGHYQMQQQQSTQQHQLQYQQQYQAGANQGRGVPQQGMNYSAAGHPAGMQQAAAYQQGGAGYNPQAAAAAAAAGAWAGYGPGAQAAPALGGDTRRQQEYRGREQQGYRSGPGQGQYGSRDHDISGGGHRQGNRGYGGHGDDSRLGPQGGRGWGRGQQRDNRPLGPTDRPAQSGFRDLLNPAEARSMMMQPLLDRHQQMQQNVPAMPSLMPALRPAAGTLGNPVNLIVNMYLLKLTGDQLLHYDVSFERVRPVRGRAAAVEAPEGPAGAGFSRGTASTEASGTSGSAAAAAAAAAEAEARAAAARNHKPPDNAREIMLRFEEQYWHGKQVCYAFDGARNLVAPGVPPDFPGDMTVAKTFQVDGIMMPGKQTPTSWKVTFKLAKQRSSLGFLKRQQERNLLNNMVRAGDEEVLNTMLRTISEQRQMLEWVLKGMLMSRTGGAGGMRAALDMVNEVGRALYFVNNPANRNIGGGLCALAGLQSGIKLTQGGLMFAADLTSSAFMRTDINLVEWMADVAGFYPRDAAGRAGGRGGRGRGPAPVGRPDVQELVRNYWTDARLRNKLNRAIKNKKVVYTDPLHGKRYKYQAVGLSAEPADAAFFELLDRKSNQGGRQISVAEYFDKVMKCKLRYSGMPVVVMKLPKSCRMDKIWIPPEHCRFAKNQRVQNVTHPGGTEQMIASAEHNPHDLQAAIHSAVRPNRTPVSTDRPNRTPDSAEVKLLEQGFGVELSQDMQRLQGRMLQGPWLTYRAGRDGEKALNSGSRGSWNMLDGIQFSDPASFRSWGLLAALPREKFNISGPCSIGFWVNDLIRRMQDLGMDLSRPMQGEQGRSGDTRRDEPSLFDILMQNMVWVDEGASALQLQGALQEVKHRAERSLRAPCQLVVCFIPDKPSDLYRGIKLAAELALTNDVHMRGIGGLGLVTQVVVARKTDLGDRAQYNKSRRSQYQANLCMKINAKLGGVNTKWAVRVGELLRGYFGLQHAAQAPTLMVFGIDLTHPGRIEGGRSIAAVVGSLDRELCRYSHQVWEEDVAGSESVSADRLTAAVQELLKQHQSCSGHKPGCLVVYRDGVSDGELERVRRTEVMAILEACAGLAGNEGEDHYRPRVVYVVVQKRHNVRFFKVDGGLMNVGAGTVVDHTIVSPWLFDFYLNSHAAIKGTSKAARYICLLDELGFGADGLQAFTYWLCYLYCRCARSVSVVAPVYYAHLLAFRARMLSDDGGDDLMSLRSGSSGGSNTNLPVFRQYDEKLAGKMFFV